MNYKIILVIFCICLFAGGMGALNLFSDRGLSLDDAFSNGKIKIVQDTDNGTIPHMVKVTNNANKKVEIAKGTVLLGKSTQDMVVARDMTILPKSKANIEVYCLDPKKLAIKGKKLEPKGSASEVMADIISSSNPLNHDNALSTQIQIWALTSGKDFNAKSNESLALCKKEDITTNELLEKIDEAKIKIKTKLEIKTELNLTSSEATNIN
jgi:hypothetical protein